MTKKQDAVINQTIASRVGKFRKAQKLTLDGLAKRAEISKGMLVQIEKGNANPSIGILCKLANAFGVSVADIVAISDGPSVRVKHRHQMPILWQGEHGGTARLLAGTKGSVMVELWRWVMFPGEVFKSEPHSKGTIELIYVEEGILSVTAADKNFLLDVESSMTATMDIAHSYENRSDAVLIFTMTVYERTS